MEVLVRQARDIRLVDGWPTSQFLRSRTISLVTP